MTPSISQHRAGPVYFLFACLLYLVASTYVGTQGLVYVSIASLTIALMVGLSKGDGSRTGSISFPLLVMVLVAAINILVSTDQSETALRWVFWFEMMVAFALLATACDETVEKSLARLLPFGAVMIWLAKYLAANQPDVGPAERESDLHLSAFFASVTISAGQFHPRVAWRWIFCLIGVYGVLVSGSRAAFLFLPLTFIAPFLYYFRSRAAAFATVLLPVVILAALFTVDTFRDATFGRKAIASGRDAIEDAQNSMTDRAYLRELAFNMIEARPLGYGYGNTYSIPGAIRKDRGTNFHNGYLNVGAAMGAPFLAAYVLFNLWLMWSLYSETRVSRLFRHLFLSILICANLRAVTEDFTLFDLANPICYLFVYMTFLYFNKRRFQPVSLSA